MTLNISDPIFRYGCIAGTFDNFHAGHEKIFDVGFKLCNYLIIRVTNDEYIYNQWKIKKEQIKPCEKRIEDLFKRLSSKHSPNRFEILQLTEEESCLNCKYGTRTQAIIVGEDCLSKAYKLNLRRRRERTL